MLALGLLLLASACSSGTSNPTTGSDPSVDVPASSSPDGESIEASSAPTASSDATSPTIESSGRPVVIFAGSASPQPWLPIGSWTPDGWTNEIDDSASTWGTTVQVASIDYDQPLTSVKLGAPGNSCAADRTGPIVELDGELDGALPTFGFEAIASTADGPLQPRSIEAAEIDGDEYQSIASSLFRPRPWLDPSQGEVVQAVRADLDGDGVDEVIIVYERVADPSRGQPGDFSLVFSRTENKGETGAKDDVLFSYATPGGTIDTSPAQARVAAIADLNGDGRMEVVLRSSVNGTAVIDVVEWSASGPVTVLVGRCSE